METAARMRYMRKLAEMDEMVSQMEEHVERALDNAMEALNSQDLPKAQAVIDQDRAINQEEAYILAFCASLIAREQPVAGDLRRIIAVMKIITDLERIGDYARNISRVQVESNNNLLFKDADFDGLASMGKLQMRNAVQAFLTNNLDLAHKTADLDKQLDEAERHSIGRLIHIAIDNPPLAKRALDTAFIGRYLERLGDHATNICEWVIYSIKGSLIESS